MFFSCLPGESDFIRKPLTVALIFKHEFIYAREIMFYVHQTKLYVKNGFEAKLCSQNFVYMPALLKLFG
jgi:hypothetical protein